ncbi:ankyrin repeat protein, putative [Trichomonas vaginalis G3]|uniref:Ankyrin repeat protein, putative n=1 Tax=Trichomonas vaginalis (strain ATCC PRA-98 / G3) TaxID=412133 RepID=A2G533_TRIV3|nr:protein ubiquitination [Trichomonas vaginalis G3]EAX87737.1 ankyrin repeat protein, putative [Trichomonas vaginalis G3]KAI5488204.1 protein ubiquitination [Trichomonas vaginalis G3]|eukprot:XP_001300667.1 ankyrin repeat protein [Trichomonas vaginalis G3]
MDNDIKSLTVLTITGDFDQKEQPKICRDLFIDPPRSYLELCCYYGSVDCFKFLRSEYNSEISKMCLVYSFYSGNPDIINECLKECTPTNNCMRYAIISHNIDFITFLMNEFQLRIDIDACKSFQNLPAKFIYFIKNNNINKFFKSFIKSFDIQIPELYEYLITHGADVNAEDSYGNPALIIAIKSGNADIVKVLLSHGADVNSKDYHWDSALIIAIKSGNADIVKVLLSHGADVNSKDYHWDSALIIAIKSGNADIVKVLLSHGADVNSKDCHWDSALIIAIKSSNADIVKVLLSHGADINARHHSGLPALEFAKQNHQFEIENHLLSFGAKIKK